MKQKMEWKKHDNINIRINENGKVELEKAY